MSLSFALLKEVTVAGFAVDANPNVTPPANDLGVLVPAGRTGGQGADSISRSLGFYLRAVDATGAEVPTATADVSVWMRDKGASAQKSGSAAVRQQWVKVASQAALVSSNLLKALALGEAMVQVTAIAAATATKYQVWGAELTT